MKAILAFEKGDAIRMVGHLDIMRAMQRALRRSMLPCRYSQGFNPHMILNFASALPVGVGAKEEIAEVTFDEELTAEEIFSALAPAMPTAMRLIKVRVVPDAHPSLTSLLAMADYEVELEPVPDAQKALDCLPAFCEKESVMITRKSKSGEKTEDVKQLIKSLKAENGRIYARVSATETSNLRADKLTNAILEFAGVKVAYRARRLSLYTSDGQPLWDM
ncbi:MAG: TIGR03936 family radical SAM-associated protein [Eubacteriales bacterium]|nr:TIGR03936 family radical SAM-associated protein [Eubacteriales bacterium]MDD3882806.1 TIGR03936 family radical SAM-associated protein [Eubacteriales bacterium]MDD4513296.1 TIGR03936 family radical SAM-associated protein [Eubacteriales bacterium]